MTTDPAGDPTDFRHVQRSGDVIRWFIDRNHAPDADALFSACVRSDASRRSLGRTLMSERPVGPGGSTRHFVPPAAISRVAGEHPI
jgi:hypothetical protein